jgi:hypothetical protein
MMFKCNLVDWIWRVSVTVCGQPAAVAAVAAGGGGGKVLLHMIDMLCCS